MKACVENNGTNLSGPQFMLCTLISVMGGAAVLTCEGRGVVTLQPEQVDSLSRGNHLSVGDFGISLCVPYDGKSTICGSTKAEGGEVLLTAPFLSYR